VVPVAHRPAGLPTAALAGNVPTLPIVTFGSWHGFTFPSKAVAGSAAQFNRSVSLSPPHSSSLHILNTCSRRLARYTASS
jgi:hypothetical protein